MKQLAILLLILLTCSVTLAQDAPTPEATAVVIPSDADVNINVGDGGLAFVEDGTAPPVEAPTNPAMASVLMLAASVAGLVQVVKPYLDKLAKDNRWSDDLHTFAVRLVAFVAALVLVFVTLNEANIIAAFGLTLTLPEWLTKVITAFVVSMGAGFIWSLFRFFKLLPVLTAIVPAAAVIATTTDDDRG